MALTRGAGAAMITALSGLFYPVLLVEADTPDGVVNIHTGLGDLSWDSKTWAGRGNLVDFRASSEETGNLVATSATVRVAGTLAAVIAELGKQYRNRRLTVWFGCVTTLGGTTLADDPVQHFTGYFDSDAFELSRLNIQGLSHDLTFGLADGPSPRAQAAFRHSNEDQQSRYSGDTGFRHVQHALKKQTNPDVWPEP